MDEVRNERPEPVDRNLIRFSQATMVTLVAAAFVLGAERGGGVIVLLTAAAMAMGVISRGASPFAWVYRTIARRGWIRPDRRAERAAPHRFSQAVGATCLGLSGIAILAGATLVGWGIALLVVTLAMINLLFGFCVGCALFLLGERVTSSWRTAG